MFPPLPFVFAGIFILSLKGAGSVPSPAKSTCRKYDQIASAIVGFSNYPMSKEQFPWSCWDSRRKVCIKYMCPRQTVTPCCGVTAPHYSLLPPSCSLVGSLSHGEGVGLLPNLPPLPGHQGQVMQLVSPAPKLSLARPSERAP